MSNKGRFVQTRGRVLATSTSTEGKFKREVSSSGMRTVSRGKRGERGKLRVSFFVNGGVRFLNVWEVWVWDLEGIEEEAEDFQ